MSISVSLSILVDNGPKPVRSEEEPCGLATLSSQQRDWVEDDVAMLFRMKLLYMVADHCKPEWCAKVMFGLEQPRDPKEYRSQQDIDQHHYMSIWRTTEWRHFQEKYALTLTSFEQGAYGHAKPKPTTFAHNIPGFDDLRGAKTQRDRHEQNWQDLPLQERMQESATWAAWAPGVKAALKEGVRRELQRSDAERGHTGAPGNAEEATWDSGDGHIKLMHQQPALCALSEVALEKWKKHILHDHQPMRRDCRVCVEAAGKSRQHRRIQHPSAYCLSIDLSGKLKRGKDQFGAPGSYVLVGCYTFPTTHDDLPLCGPGVPPLPEDAPLPALGEMVDEDGVEGDVEDGELPRLEVEEEEDVGDCDEQALKRAKIACDSWMKLVKHCQQVKVRTLTFVEVVQSRATGHIMEGLAKIYSRVRSLGLPVLRLHADRARELTSKAVQSWCHQRDMVATYTSGSDWKSNGRAENEIGIVKRHAKILMRAHGADVATWPILIRHAAERRLRWQLRQVGYPVPELLPFNTKVMVKRKSWNQRYQDWRWERAPGRIRGPDPWSSLTSGGYCVELEDGKFVASTDVVVESVESGEELPVELLVQERLQAPSDRQLDEVPRRRLRGKQGIPQMSKMELGSNSGETGGGQHDDQPQLQPDGQLQLEEERLLSMHQAVSKVLAEECILVDDMEVDQMACIPSLSMLAHQKFDLENQLQAMDREKTAQAEEDNFLVTKTVTADQVYKEWGDWKEAMMNEYQSIVMEKKAVRQVSRAEALKWAEESGIKYEELPSKVVFTRKMGGKRKVRACICGNFEGEVSTATYAGGCDASQIRCVTRHASLKGWQVFTTDIKCAFLNAERKDRSKLIAMSIPQIYVKLGAATAHEVWIVDAAMYGLVSSPRDWADHRDRVIPKMTWVREEAERHWHGFFQQAADQHLWHLKERCQETGEERNCGVMAIYVDDVLLTADEKTATSALQAISSVWECAPAEQATLHSSVTFCGFEIQRNEAQHGGGYRMHQRSYEEELVKKWEIEEVKYQLDVKLPTPEEEAEFQQSEDAEAVKKAQACTGALLWLATRTRPEISVGVAAMSRLCMKAPEIALDIGRKLMSYLKRPTLGMIYAETPGPQNGARDQLSKPRCEKTIEAFSDISYASTKGYRSVQGQVYFYAGAPIMWNTNRQPFPTQSTAESELVSLCEALVGGRATAALVASIRDESPDKLVKRLWGDNAAAISLAKGDGQGSWRTRHLRIRAAILRSALHQEEWELGHLKGHELVADSFTKVVNGPAFERALQDLCIAAEENKVHSSGGGIKSDQLKARVAMLVGATLMSGAAATKEEEGGDKLSWFWTVGLILMLVGAVYVGNKMIRSGMWIHQRLQGASGSQTNAEVKGQQVLPQLRMLRRDSSEDEWSVIEEEGSAHYAQTADMDDLRMMVAQSRRIEEDPHNKMHGRTPESWQYDEDERACRGYRLHVGDQLPRRRKKKNKNKKQDRGENDDEAIDRAWTEMMRTTRNLHAATSSMSSMPQSGSHNPACVSSSLRISSRSGLREGERSTSMSIPSSSGSHSAGAGSSTSRMTSQSGLASAPAAADCSVRASSQSGTASSTPAGESQNSVSHRNSWNRFQMEHAGKGWGSEKMRAEYWRQKATGRSPK